MDNDAKDSILAKREEQRQIEWEIQELAGHFMGKGEARWHKISVKWECPSSPFGWCAFHIIEDPANDGCVFCHQPQERK